MPDPVVTAQPTTKEIATFFQWVLPFGLADGSDVISWADQLVEATPSPIPVWLVELSTASSADALELSHLLDVVPGDFRPELVVRMSIAAFYLEFVLHFEQRRALAWHLHELAEARKLPRDRYPQLHSAYYRYDEAFEGNGSVSEVDDELYNFLAGHVGSVPFLPPLNRLSEIEKAE